MNKLTGRTRFRAAEIIGLGTLPAPALVWQVETVHLEQASLTTMRNVYEWRDAQVEDLCEINHVVYSNINVTVYTPDGEAHLPGEKTDARKLH